MAVGTVPDMARPDITGVLLGWGERLVAARTAAGLTQEAVAVELGVSLKTIQRWEALGRDGGGNLPSTQQQARLADLYGVQVSDLLPRTEREGTLEGIAAEYDDLLERVGNGCS